uniref:Uncharacterized protein n=1 Tax=Tetranychus urticae TaxID=32264 RepID=T1K4J2_TETUR
MYIINYYIFNKPKKRKTKEIN